MSRNFISKWNGLKLPVYSSLAMAFAGMGDAFLYPFLPLYAGKMGIPVSWVGVLLSINRFARILLSPAITRIFKNFNLRHVTIISSSVAVCSTIGYGLNAGLIAWIIFRIAWGLCFSAMRITTASYALNLRSKGFALGLSNGIYEVGPLLALSLGPLIVSNFDIEYTFYFLALVSSVALFFAYRIPAGVSVEVTTGSQALQNPSAINLLTFLSAFVAEGFVIMVMSMIIRKHYLISTLEAASISSGLLILRRAFSLFASPIGGLFVDWLGSRKMLVVSILCVSVGVISLSGGNVLAGLFVIFSFHPISNAILIIVASAGEMNQIAAINRNATYRDAGAALGTLCGGFLLLNPYLDNILFVCALFPVFLVIFIIKHTKPI